jgi:protein CpxP
MFLSPEQREVVASELKQIGAKLNLSDDQKDKLQAYLTEASEKVQEYKKQNPNASTLDLVKKVADNRANLRQRVENFLTPDQLSIWDAEMAKAKEFLGQKLAA